MKKANIFTSLLLTGVMVLSGCGASNTAESTIIGGAVVGAGVGSLLGGSRGAATGARIGAEAGAKGGKTEALISNKLDKQKAELLEIIKNVKIPNQEEQEFVIEKAYNSTQFYKEAGCTPHNGVLVFHTTIPDLEFSMPDTPNRLLRVSDYDAKNNGYLLCVEPTEQDVDSRYAQYSIQITAQGYKPAESFVVSSITPGIAQHFMISPKQTSQQTEQIPQPSVSENRATVSENVKSGNASQKTPATFSYAALNLYIEAEQNRVAENYPEAIQYYLEALAIVLC